MRASGIQAISIHGRTRAQSYRGEANWNVIDECARAVGIPVIGNGDISSGADVERRKRDTAVSGVMIGRAAMSNPWVFREAKHYLETGQQPEPPSVEQRWELVRRHCKLAIGSSRYGDERHTMMAMRSRLMAYSRGLVGGKLLRTQFSSVSSLAELEDLIASYMKFHESRPARRRQDLRSF